MKAKFKMETLRPKIITENMVLEYMELCELFKHLSKRKEEIRKSLLEAYPGGGEVGSYMIFVDDASTRSFPLEVVKAKVSDQVWANFYEPFIKITMYPKLTIKDLNNK